MSGLEDAIVDYVTVRRALGFKLNGVERLLHEYVAFLEQRGEQRITINTGRVGGAPRRD